MSLVGVAWPLFVEQALRILIMTVDTFMVSHVSDGAVAALGVATQVLVLSIILFNFIGIGSSVVITHHLGAGDRPGADRIAAAAIGVNTWVGLLVSAVVASLAPLHPAPAAAPAGAVRLRAAVPHHPGRDLVPRRPERGHGGGAARPRPDPRRHVRHRVQNVLNVAGNCILLFGLLGAPRMGVTGVALSSAFARLAAFVALRILVAKRTGIWLGWRDYLTFPVRELGRILHIGLPAAGENLSYWVALIVVTSYASRLGETPIAIFTYTRTVMMWVILFSISIGLATEIVVGHLVGAGAFDEVYHRLLRSVRTGLLLVGGATIALFLGGPWIFRAFTHDPVVVKGCVTLLFLELILEPGRVFNIVVINSLRATGDARFPVFMGACSMWGVLVPVAGVLSLWTPLGVTGIWIAFVCDEWLRAMMMYRRWRRRGWLKYAQRSHDNVAALASPEVAESA